MESVLPPFYRIRDLFLDAMIMVEALAIKWPATIVELLALSLGFQQKSSNGVFTGCVGALDGLLLLHGRECAGCL